MRKIIIDDNIRNFASEYSSKVQAKCPNVITDLKKLRDNVISFNPQIDQSIVKNYINEIVLDYPNLIKMEPKDWNFKKYEKILQKNPDILSQKVNYDIKKKNAAGKPIEYYEEVLYKRIMFCLRYDETRIILGEIHQKMKLKENLPSLVIFSCIPTIQRRNYPPLNFYHKLQRLHPKKNKNVLISNLLQKMG